MNLDYHGYTLNVIETRREEEEEITGKEAVYVKVSCERLYSYCAYYSIDYWNSNSETIISNFKEQVKNKR